jgi:PAS domain S-box-containing protein
MRPGLRPRNPLLMLLCGGFVLSGFGAGQQTVGTDPTYLIKTWETDDGLPENSATAMAQTLDGYLWFGTYNGLVRFDGVKFTVFDSANTPQLPSNEIVSLYCDRSGRLWVGTLRGLVMKEEASARWRTFTTNDGWAGNHVRTFTERANGDLLVTTFDGHVLEFVNGRFSQLPPPPGAPGEGYIGCVDEAGLWWVAQYQFIGVWDGHRWISKVLTPPLSSDEVGCCPARDGGLWLLIRGELRKYRHGVEVSRIQLPELPGGFWSMSEDSLGNLWICSYQEGVCRVAPDGTMRRWAANARVHPNTRFAFEDRERNLWIGTSGGGLVRFRPRRFQSFGVENGLAEPQINSVWPDRDGGLWIVTAGKGLFRLHDGSVTNSLPDTYVRSVLTDHAGRLWVGTGWDLWVSDQAGLHVAQSDLFHGPGISALFEDSRGRIWISSGRRVAVRDGEHLDVFNADGWLPGDSARCFAEDSQGVLWLSTFNGVFRLVSGRFAEVQHDGQPLRDVICLKADPDGTLWMGTLENGLLAWRSGHLARIGTEAGLPVRAVSGILEDDAGFFWLASDRGVVRVPAKDIRLAADGKASRLDCRLLDLSDGLPSVECASGHQSTCARDASGRLWFATLKGVAMIDPAAFRLNTNLPPVTVEEVVYHTPAPKAARRSTNDSTVRGFNGSTAQNEVEVRLAAPFTEPLRLPAGSRHVEIHYTALSFSAPESVRFQVKLDLQDADWHSAGDRRVASFYDFRPGDYVFHVRAANNDGVLSESGASLAFTVLPFYWQTVWFRIAAALGLVGGGAGAAWGIVRSKLRRQQEELDHRRALDKAQQRLDLAADGAELGVWEWDIHRNSLWITERGKRVFGYSADDQVTLGMLAARVHPDDRVMRDEAIQRALAGGGSYDLEYRLLLPDGAVRWIAGRGHVECDRAGKPVLVRGISVDISVRKRAETESQLQRMELLHVSRVTTLSELSGSLAHELNQPLAIILTNAQAAQRLLSQSPPDLAEARDILADIVSEDQRAGEVIRRLRSLLKPGETNLEPLSVNEILEDVLRITRSDLLGRGITISRALSCSLPCVLGDRVQLQQVLLNLILNACDAMAANPPAHRLLTLTSTQRDALVRVSVSDNGCGLPAAGEDVFEPFYTTKKHGLGLGLSICRSIVNAHDGRLWAEANGGAGGLPAVTKEDPGVTFHVELPAAMEGTS